MNKHFALLWVFFLIFSFTARSQSMQEWTWDEYHVKFSVPTSFKVLSNSSTEFSSGNSNMNLTIYPRRDENLEYNQMSGALARWARENKVSYSGSPNYMENLNGYWGVYIDGTVSGSPVSLLLIEDPDYPEVTMYIWLSYTSAHYNTAVRILKSFTPN
jgi:hypothetical protein